MGIGSPSLFPGPTKKAWHGKADENLALTCCPGALAWKAKVRHFQTLADTWTALYKATLLLHHKLHLRWQTATLGPWWAAAGQCITQDPPHTVPDHMAALFTSFSPHLCPLPNCIFRFDSYTRLVKSENTRVCIHVIKNQKADSMMWQREPMGAYSTP